MNVRLNYDMHFTAGIYYNDMLRMNNYVVKIWMTTMTKNIQDQNTAFERIKYFVYTQMDSTVFINQNNYEQCKKFAEAGINLTTLPGEPVDQLIGIMLYYKLNAITEQRMEIVETEISSSLGENITYLHSDFEDSLGFESPDWWNSAELTHSSLSVQDSEKIVTISQNASWRDLDLSWNETVPEKATGNIVVFADFKQPDETK